MIGGLAAVVLAAFVTLLVVWANDDSPDTVVAGTSTSSAPTSTSTSTSTTVSPATSSTATSTTAAPAATTPTAAPPTTAVQPIVTGQGAVLAPPASPDVRTVPAGGNCSALADAGWEATCGTTGAKDAVLAWVVETRQTELGRTARRVLIFRRGSGQQWTLVLRAGDESGTQYTDIRARVEDVSGDGTGEIAVGFRRVGASAVLDVDLVEGPGVVAVHRELPRGAARVSSGQLDTWRRLDSSRFSHEVIQFRDRAWRIVGSAVVPAGDVPPSQL